MKVTAFCLTPLGLIAVPISAQVRGAINGTVMDSSGALVGKARVELDAPATGLHRDTITGPSGIYQFPSLPIGTYTLGVSAQGFEEHVLEGVDVFNMFNNAVCANPSGNLGSDPAKPAADFGRITSLLNTDAVGTETYRALQFAVRLGF